MVARQHFLRGFIREHAEQPVFDIPQEVRVLDGELSASALPGSDAALKLVQEVLLFKLQTTNMVPYKHVTGKLSIGQFSHHH